MHLAYFFSPSLPPSLSLFLEKSREELNSKPFLRSPRHQGGDVERAGIAKPGVGELMEGLKER